MEMGLLNFRFSPNALRVRVRVDHSRLEVTELRKEAAFADEYKAYEVAESYVSKLPHVPYQEVGLNWHITMEKENPNKWLMDRFLKPGKWLVSDPRVVGSKLILQLNGATAICNMEFAKGTVEPEAIAVNCNFHYKGPLSAEDINGALRSWPACQEFLKKALDKLFVKQLS